MEKEKISFIIPAYNSEKIIIKCLDNICIDIDENNMSKNVEVLVIENGSKDQTTKKVSEYIKKNKKYNIQLLHSDQGVSKARNKGIKHSIGEYLIFVDSDDYWLKGSLKRIENDIKETNADLYAYSFIKGTNSQSESECIKNIHESELLQDYNLEDKIAWFLSKPTARAQVWAKVFKRDIIIKENLNYNEELRYSEDSEFLIRYLFLCQKIEISSHTIYKYVISSSSVMHTFDETRISGYINSMEISEKYIEFSYEHHGTIGLGTPDPTTIASLIDLNSEITTVKFFNNFTKLILSLFVISFTFLFLSIPDNSIIGSINFCGNNSNRLFLNNLFFSFSKSLKILESNFSSLNAGFKSIFNTIFPLFNN